MVFGIVVEAERDSVVYSTLIRRIRTDVDDVLARPCQNVVGVRRKFVACLKNFQWHSGYNVGKAFVVRDSDCRDSQAVEDELVRILDQSGFRGKLTLPVHFYATRCMVETWAAGGRERGQCRCTEAGQDSVCSARCGPSGRSNQCEGPFPTYALPSAAPG
jgi:hypothetical protein